MARSSSPSRGENEKLMHVRGKNATEDHKAVAGESYMEKHPKLFQITTEPHYKDTGSWLSYHREDAKEKALAKYSIDVLGKQLLIFRVDAPRTTVIRLCNVNRGSNSVTSICNTYGKVKSIKHRRDSIVDVFFCTTEWPNMLDILNSLNGLEVNGRRCIAQPAPIFPPPILQALWRHPGERRRVIATMQSLLSKVEHTMCTDGLTEMAAFESFYNQNGKMENLCNSVFL